MGDELTALRARCERLERLYQVGKVIHSTLDPQETLRLLVRESVALTGATSGSVALLNPTNGLLEIHATHGLPAGARDFRLRRNEGITGWVVQHARPALVGDVRADPRYVTLVEGVRSELAVPLLVDGEVRGVLNVDSDRPDAFTPEAQALLEELAGQAESVIRNTWGYEQIRVKAQLFESLISVSQAVNSTLNLDDALRVVTREACALMGARVGSLFLVEPGGEWLELRASHGAGPEYVNKPPLSVSESLIGTVVRRRRHVQEPDVQNSGRYQHGLIAQGEGLVSLLSVPLVFAGRCIGALNVYTHRPHVFSNEEVRILSALADLSAIAIEKARLYERLVDVEEQLRQSEKLSAIGLLAAEVAHEIRNPLTVMKMLYHSLDLRFPADDPRAEDARIMGEKMNHLNRVVEQILDFARRSEPRLTPVNVNQLIEELGLLTRHKLRQQNIELVRRLADGLPELRADATQLEQAFLNLTLNAVQAMPAGGRLTISTRLKRGSGGGRARVVIQFGDTGVGMGEEERAQVFSSWFTGGKPGGTGLGLAIVSRVVETHGGTVRVQSKPGAGSTFILSLPVREPAAQ